MIIDCISDTHGYYPKLEGGDLLIVAGDLTARDTEDEYYQFNTWICDLEYRKKIVIAGNHDNLIQKDWFEYLEGSPAFEYLCDSGTEFEGYKIWGSPWSLKFQGMNPKCMAFTCDTEEELSKKWDLIPDDVGILVTHGPPKGILDWNVRGNQCGSESLLSKSASLKNLKLFVFGHIHEAYSFIDVNMAKKVSQQIPCDGYSMPIVVNASHVNEYYKPVNKPVRIEL